jgi:hypothetical protein
MHHPSELKQVLDEHFVSYDDRSCSAHEDLAPYLDGTEEIHRFVVITRHGDFVYAYPYFHDLGVAKHKAREHIGDDIFYEVPEVIVDLETGDKHYPQWHTLEWT